MAIDDRSITIVGCGPGSADCLTVEALKAVDAADVIVGASRLLKLFPQSSAERVEVGADIERVLAEIAARCVSRRVVVLVTGDPGLCSLAQPVIRRFGREKCKVVPGISSVQMAFARVGLDWYGARIISVHGREPDATPNSLADTGKLAILTEGNKSLPRIAEFAQTWGRDTVIFICENLSLGDERIRQVVPEELYGITVSSRTIVLLIKGELLR